MAVDITTEQTISKPTDAVSAYAADPSNACEWYVNIKSVEWITKAPLKIGSRVAFAKFLGRRLAYTYDLLRHPSLPDPRLATQEQQRTPRGVRVRHSSRRRRRLRLTTEQWAGSLHRGVGYRCQR